MIHDTYTFLLLIILQYKCKTGTIHFVKFNSFVGFVFFVQFSFFFFNPSLFSMRKWKSIYFFGAVVLCLTCELHKFMSGSQHYHVQPSSLHISLPYLYILINKAFFPQKHFHLCGGESISTALKHKSVHKVEVTGYFLDLNFSVPLYCRVQIKIGPAAQNSNQWVYFGRGLLRIRSALTEQHEKELTLFFLPRTHEWVEGQQQVRERKKEGVKW